MKYIYILDAVIIAILLYWGISALYYRMKAKRLNGALKPDVFEKTMRKAQLVDTREKQEFDNKHILGARNLPYTQFKMNVSELRKDLPIYLYDRTVKASVRAASKLKKWGYSDVHWLDQDFTSWEGKVKKSTKL